MLLWATHGAVEKQINELSSRRNVNELNKIFNYAAHISLNCYEF